MKKKQRSKGGARSSQGFWDKEYKDQKGRGSHLALSTNPSEDLQKFIRFLERHDTNDSSQSPASVVDLGCGNGRNLIYLSQEFGMKGTGFDIAASAIAQAKKVAKDDNLPLVFDVRSITGDLPFENESQSLVLDMMVSHFLKADQRMHLVHEIARILKPSGWLFFKTFLLDEDRHAKRLLSEHPSEETGSYIHPEIGVMEHVSTEEEIVSLLSPLFKIHKIQKSHGHLRKGSTKRRSISVYAERLY